MNTETEWPRDALLAELRKKGARVTAERLHRWTNAGLLPRPKRRGLGKGKGKGTISVYPASALSQAYAIHLALQISRDLDDAGWVAWLMGFPLTEYVRDLLIEEWTRQERDLRRGLKALQKPRVQSRIAHAVTSGSHGLEGLLSVLSPGGSPSNFSRIAQMLLAVQVGELHQGVFTLDEWDDLRESVIAQQAGSPSAVAEPLEQFVASTIRRSRQVSFRALIARLKRATEKDLCDCRDELCALHAIAAVQAGQMPGLITRAAFRHYFAERLLDVERAPQVRELLRAYGIEVASLATADGVDGAEEVAT